ncbi:MAG: NRAMP family divalent metal transporter, partial [Maioricimonas sp. JB049]
NLGVLAALEPWLTETSPAAESLYSVSNAVLLGLNGAIILFLFGSKKLYIPIERLMMLLVGLMILAFFGNFIFLLASGGAPAANSNASTAPPPQDALVSVLALIGTTFSIAGAFYQAYLVREKGWGIAEVKRGLIDSVAGISVLGIISLVIMLTAAISFHGRDVQLATVSDVARQLEPLFGPSAVILFSLGIFAGAFSSFLVNAMIGGAMLADGLGFGGRMDSMATKWFTTAALLLGMCVALFVPTGQRVGLVIFAQAMVVTGFPLLAASMLYLAAARDLEGERRIPRWMLAIASLGLVVVLISAARLGYTIVLRLMGPS